MREQMLWVIVLALLVSITGSDDPVVNQFGYGTLYCRIDADRCFRVTPAEFDENPHLDNVAMLYSAYRANHTGNTAPADRPDNPFSALWRWARFGDDSS